jgi:hypothetical protein
MNLDRIGGLADKRGQLCFSEPVVGASRGELQTVRGHPPLPFFMQGCAAPAARALHFVKARFDQPLDLLRKVLDPRVPV